MNPQPLLPIGSLTGLGMLGMVLIGVAGLLSLAAVVGSVRNWDVKQTGRLLIAGSVSFFGAFAILMTLFITNQFQFRYVWRHSALDHEMSYRVAGVWSGQEGSFLLWAICSAVFGVITLRFTGKYRRGFTGVYAAFLAALAGILSFESPFFLNPAGAPVIDGNGMSPTLMNYWIVIHPPTIFLGFGALTALYAWAMAALIHRDLDTWVDQVRPWSLVALTLVGTGLCMGGFWAYETLGWGGFWMWDPVENTSFVPWVIVACLVHGIFIQKARKKWHIANVVLAGLPFLAFGYGTFLTRSGFLGDTSVHSFAQMDRSALFILIALISTAMIAFGVTIAKAMPWWKQNRPEGLASSGALQKEAFYSLGTKLLLFMGAVTGFGMSVPLVQSLMGQQPKVVEEQLYNTVTSFAFIPLIVLMAIGPFLTWKGQGFGVIAKKFVNTLALTIFAVGVLMNWLTWGGREVQFGPLVIGFPGQPADFSQQTSMLMGVFQVPTAPWVLALTGLCLFALFANLGRMFQLAKTSKTSIGGMLTHFGVIMTMTGLIFSRGLQQKIEGIVHPSKELPAFGYLATVEGTTSSFVDRNNKVKVRFEKPNGDQFLAKSGLYFTPGQDGAPQEHVWPHIQHHGIYDIYVVVRAFVIEDGQPDFGGSEPVGLMPGQRAEFNRYVFEYKGLKTEGTPGTFGATFKTPVSVWTPEGEKSITPYVKLLGPGEMERPIIDIGDGLGLQLDRIDAATNQAFFIVHYTTPAYPIQIFYKPLTGFVWWGVGIMTIGGFLSAWYRRRSRPEPPTPSSDSTTEPALKPEENADAPPQPVEV